MSVGVIGAASEREGVAAPGLRPKHEAGPFTPVRKRALAERVERHRLQVGRHEFGQRVRARAVVQSVPAESNRARSPAQLRERAVAGLNEAGLQFDGSSSRLGSMT